MSFAIALAPRAVEISEAIDLGGPEKTKVDAPLLEETHHVEHFATLRGAANIGGIAHREEHF